MVRRLEHRDYNYYLRLIAQLTDVGNVSQEQFNDFVDSQNNNWFTLVYETGNKVVACVTVLLERKIAHSNSAIIHIEDVVTDSEFRGFGISRKLIDYIKESAKGKCYKIILDCAEHNVKFYEKLGFKQTQFQMRYEVEA